MSLCNHLPAGSLVTGLAAAGLIAAAAAQDAAPFGGEEDVAYAETLWNALVDANLAGDNAVNTVPYEGVEPHGLVLETLYRDLEVDGHTGLVVVKRNYGPEGVTVEEVTADRSGHFDSVTVMFEREEGYDPENDNWFWAKYGFAGSLDETPDGEQMAGRVAGCIGCHQEAEGGDYLFTFNR
jgi:hypothetical protein